jgi:hypothetical protein
MPIVDIYCRTATDEPETRTTLERQETECRAYCQEHRLAIGIVHHEIASGTTYEREHLSLMRSRYRNQLIQGVVVTYIPARPYAGYTNCPIRRNGGLPGRASLRERKYRG